MRGLTLQHAFFITLLVLTTVAFVGLILPYLMPVFWAVVLAVVFRPVQVSLIGRLGGRASLAACATIAIVTTIVIVPLVVVGVVVSREVVGLYEPFGNGEVTLDEPLGRAKLALPRLNAYLDQAGIDTTMVWQKISEAGAAVGGFVASHAVRLGQSAARITVLTALMLYLLFFFLRDGERLIARIFCALPLSYAHQQQLLSKCSEVLRATIKGTCVTGAAQGGLGGLFFWILGLPAPALCGALMALLSLVPAVGPAVIWGPAAVFLFFSGEVGRSIILVVAGVLAIGLVDNVLRPLLVGRDTRMPDFLILLATIGGLTVLGVSGFVIGPILASLFVTVWGMFEKEFRDQPTTP